MKIAVPAQGNELTSPVDQRFGRSAWFILIDSDTEGFEACANPNLGAAGGAGIQTAQFLSRQGIQTVLAGNVGPNAVQALRAADIAVYTGISGTVADSLDQYRQGQLVLCEQATVGAKTGMGMGGRGGPGRQRS